MCSTFRSAPPTRPTSWMSTSPLRSHPASQHQPTCWRPTPHQEDSRQLLLPLAVHPDVRAPRGAQRTPCGNGLGQIPRGWLPGRPGQQGQHQRRGRHSAQDSRGAPSQPWRNSQQQQMRRTPLVSAPTTMNDAPVMTHQHSRYLSRDGVAQPLCCAPATCDASCALAGPLCLCPCSSCTRYTGCSDIFQRTWVKGRPSSV